MVCVCRDDVGLPGFAAYFKHNSDEEREHATKLMVQQSRRGGRVQLKVGMATAVSIQFSAVGAAVLLWVAVPDGCIVRPFTRCPGLQCGRVPAILHRTHCRRT